MYKMEISKEQLRETIIYVLNRIKRAKIRRYTFYRKCSDAYLKKTGVSIGETVYGPGIFDRILGDLVKENPEIFAIESGLGELNFWIVKKARMHECAQNHKLTEFF